MSLPITEQVAQEFERRIKSIQIASGYQINLDAARYNRQRGTTTAGTVQNAYSADIHEFDEEPIDTPAQQHLEWTKEFIVIVYLNESESSTVPLDQRANIVIAELKKAIASDRTLGNLVIDTRCGTMRRFDAEPGIFGVAAQFLSHVRELEADPYNR